MLRLFIFSRKSHEGVRVSFINSYVTKMPLFPPKNTGVNSWLTTFSQNTIDAVVFSLGFYYCSIIPQ